MLARYCTLLSVCLMVGVMGCGKSHGGGNTAASGQGDAATAQAGPQPGPAAVVAEFLEAVRTGNDQHVMQMLSPLARQKMAEKNRSVTPPASDTAKFEVGSVDYVGSDGARVACNWIDLDENGKPRTDHSLWVLRHGDDGWRVVGVAATVFDGEPPLLLNFEDPEDMDKKQQWLRDEIARRSQPQPAAIKSGEAAKDPLRR